MRIFTSVVLSYRKRLPRVLVYNEQIIAIGRCHCTPLHLLKNGRGPRIQILRFEPLCCPHHEDQGISTCVCKHPTCSAFSFQTLLFHSPLSLTRLSALISRLRCGGEHAQPIVFLIGLATS